MILTPKIEKAIKKAGLLHDGQKRKAKENLPYITHLFSVAAILSSHAGDDEDLIVAGLLHDSIEDTDYTLQELEKEFGPRVMEIVRDVTETKTNYGVSIPWKRRKLSYLENLKRANAESLMVAAADKIHNLESIVGDYKRHGSIIWKNFKAPIEEQLWFFEAVLAILEERLQSSIVKHLRKIVEEAKELFITK